MMNTPFPANRSNLAEVARVFFRLGCIAFGGPAAHISMMEDEVVRKRKWISGEHFLDLVGATNLIPGPNSTEMTMHCGHERAGWKGLVIAGMCFILPAVVITGVIAWAYEEFGSLPNIQRFIYGIKPAIIAIIVSTMISLGKKAMKSFVLAGLGVMAAIITLLGVNEIYVLFGGGLIGILIYFISRPERLTSLVPLVLFTPVIREISGWQIFLTFLKIGAILYGSGYVLFAFLDAELVNRGLLSKQQLIDAIAVGQFTPGPVFSSATFIGWQLGGIYGAVAATVGIFLPSFIFVAFSNPIIPKLRRSPVMSAFLDAVNVVSIAIILAVVIEMGRETLLDWRTVIIAIVSFGVMLYFKRLNSALIVIGGAVLGYLLTLI